MRYVSISVISVKEAMLEEMLKDPQVRIQYASKYAGSTNAYKNAIGSNWAINKRNFEQVKNDEQDRLIAWSKKMCEPAYPEALLTLEQIVNDRKDLRFRSWMLDEALTVASSSPKFRPISRLFVRLWRGKIVPSSKNRSLNWRGLSTVSLIRIMRRWLIRR